MEMKFTTANFEEEVLKSEIPVLVDFYADWCGPCQMMAPVIGQLAGEYEGKVKIGKLNVDENPDIAVQYKVMSIPTMIIFRNGEVFSKEVGASSKKEVEKAIGRALYKLRLWSPAWGRVKKVASLSPGVRSSKKLALFLAVGHSPYKEKKR